MRRRAVLALVGAAVALAVAGAVLGWPGHLGRTARQAGGPADARAPAGVRIRVEVLNATRTRGLARLAAMHLRDRGFDVVGVGTSPEQRDSSLVLDRTGHPDWAALVARAIGGARVEARPDTSRYLDVTVLVGAAWRPPAEPFYP